jgi:hypothetical protein
MCEALWNVLLKVLVMFNDTYDTPPQYYYHFNNKKSRFVEMRRHIETRGSEQA